MKKPTKLWSSKPNHEEIEEFLKDFFKTLQEGEVDKAKTMVAHAYPDWDEEIYTIWQDHYLIHEIPKDNTFEGGEWKSNKDWLKDLTIDNNFEWTTDSRVSVGLVYQGKPSGYIGEFMVDENDDGEFYVKRILFHMA